MERLKGENVVVVISSGWLDIPGHAMVESAMLGIKRITY